jgi:predicted nucleic acid-binding protein
VDAAAVALAHHQIVLPPVVLSELLSALNLHADVRDVLVALPLLAVTDGYWERAGLLRARILSQGRRANLADTLIAQPCVDHDVELITRDTVFRHFTGPAGLKLSSWRAR